MEASIDLARPARPATARVAVWLLLGVVFVLFVLCLLAYAMRMRLGDWRALPLPWQLNVSTAMLILSSASLQWASVAARRGGRCARGALFAAFVFAAAFLAAQAWAWQALVAQGRLASANPSNGFFFLLTGLHALHVLGGIVALLLAGRRGERLGLCALYWHGLLAVWLLLYATMAWLTPAIVDFICGVA
ncbi:cytochrome c oxidase subunit 3 [Crenobacter luteus]|uniref:bb3-type cytochrome oxidase subunit III n=1 Tax=Crenobacter luteus TaxID=1452487 RepID=UPI00104DB932|nr:bb3-type cytochrome oxidase subunit III [Crenobacter luteus]TCP10681.1 cytochrome c oxidase subunit 3 [Crenobacter luteus]